MVKWHSCMRQVLPRNMNSSDWQGIKLLGHMVNELQKEL